MRVNTQGYVERRIRTGRRGGRANAPYRNWWFVIHHCQIDLSKLSLPEKYLGKRIRIKVEIIEDDEKVLP